MLGNRSEHVSGSLLVEAVLFGKRVDQLGKNLIGDNSLGELVGVVGKATKSESSRLLDRWYVVEEEWAEECHHTG